MVKAKSTQESDNLKKTTQTLKPGRSTKGISKKKHSQIPNKIPESAFATYRSAPEDASSTYVSVPSTSTTTDKINTRKQLLSQALDSSSSADADVDKVLISHLAREGHRLVKITVILSCHGIGCVPPQCTIRNDVASPPLTEKIEESPKKLEVKDWKAWPFGPYTALAMTESCEGVKVFGNGLIRAVKGFGKIMGHILSPENPPEKFFAPNTHTALLIQPSTSQENNNIIARNVDGLEDETIEEILKMFQDHCTVLLVSSLTEMLTLPGYRNIYDVQKFAEKLTPNLFVVKTQNYIQEFQQQNAIATEIVNYAESWKSLSHRRPVILTAGGKNTGKSSFNRYLINRLLRVVPFVYYLECDLGQTEFTPSGIISACHVSRPLLGPPFTHQTIPDFSVFYGHNQPGDQPDRYLQSLLKVYTEIRSADAPIVVNTMGWNKGLGLQLLINTIHMVEPTHLIQMLSWKDSKNASHLSIQHVSRCDVWNRDIIEKKVLPDYKLCEMDDRKDFDETVPYKPSDNRDLNLLASLQLYQNLSMQNQNLSNNVGFDTSSFLGLKPFSVNLRDIVLCTTHDSGIKRSLAMGLFNASFVGLCLVPQNFKHCNKENTFLPLAPVCECIGFGIVRGISPDQNVLFVITHLMEEDFRRVNCLVRGALNVPRFLFQ